MIGTLTQKKTEIVEQLERWLQEVGSTGRFLLRHHFHKGPTVIRGMPVSHWDIVIDLGKGPLLEFSAMEQNPLWDPDKPVYCTRKTCSDYTPQGKPNREWIDFEGSIPPKGVHLTKVELGKQISKGIYEYTERGELKTSNPKFPCQYTFKKGEEVWADSRRNLYNSDRSIGNPTKILPTYMLAEDRGRIKVLEDNPMFMSMQLFGKKLRGYYVLKRESPDSPIWVFSKSALPGEKRKGLEKTGEKSLEERGLEDFEYLLHHIHVDEKGKEETHHCFLYDHIANMFEQGHLAVKNGKAFLDGKEIKDGIFHIIRRLEPTQEIVWSDEEAEENGIKPKEMKPGMTLKEKAKEW